MHKETLLMATRIENILKKARYSLADPNKERYTDERLLEAISEGQRDIARQTRLLKAEVEIVLSLAEPLYKLPSDLWLITRATFDNTPIPLMSYDRMDERDCTWYTDFGNRVEALIYDKRNMQEIRVYPRPDESYTLKEYSFVADNPLATDSAGLTAEQILALQAYVAALDTLVAQPDLQMPDIYANAGGIINILPTSPDAKAMFGVVTSLDGLVAQPLYGVLTDIELVNDYKSWPGDVQFSSLYGVTTGVSDTTGILHINYIKDPEDLVSTEDELVLPPIFDNALRYYVAGQAFADDLDSQYQAKAGDSMAMYNRELQTVGYPTNERDGTRATQYTPNYIGPFGN